MGQALNTGPGVVTAGLELHRHLQRETHGLLVFFVAHPFRNMKTHQKSSVQLFYTESARRIRANGSELAFNPSIQRCQSDFLRNNIANLKLVCSAYVGRVFGVFMRTLTVWIAEFLQRAAHGGFDSQVSPLGAHSGGPA